MSEQPLHSLSEKVQALDERGALEAVDQALAGTAGPLEVLRAAEEGMRGVGRRYERKEIFLSGLIMAGEIFRQITDQLQPGLSRELHGQGSGRVLLGTVSGDIHDIGKNMVGLFLEAYGFTVLDLGVNVPPERFLEAARDFRPDIIGMSGLVTAAFRAMRETVERVREQEGDGPPPVLVIGGATLDDDAAAAIGADYWTTDAMEGVRLCQAITEKRGPRSE